MNLQLEPWKNLLISFQPSSSSFAQAEQRRLGVRPIGPVGSPSAAGTAATAPPELRAPVEERGYSGDGLWPSGHRHRQHAAAAAGWALAAVTAGGAAR